MSSSPYIGILLDNVRYNGIPRERTGFEHISFYEEAGNMYDFIPCFFRIQDLIPGENQIQAYVKGENNKYLKQSVPVPKVIHNRAFINTKREHKKIQQLIDNGIMIFNQKNRYRKIQVHEILLKNLDLHANLPMTLVANEKNIFKMLKNFDSLIIKPNSSSLGIGVMLISKDNDEYKWTFRNRTTKAYESLTFRNQLPQSLLDIIAKRTYLVQQRIPLASYQGNPFDLRVSVQKNRTGNWQVTGVVGKVANQGHYVTNIARGGKAYPLDVLMEGKTLNHDLVYTAIEKFSLQAAEQLSSELSGLADLGLDIGITEEGFPMFIECNARDLRITFRNAKMESTWKATHTTPLSYARYLLDTSF
jgi:glutathione synthase/RimK-type ligase-like ATP-grasp enzyme